MRTPVVVYKNERKRLRQSAHLDCAGGPGAPPALGFLDELLSTVVTALPSFAARVRTELLLADFRSMSAKLAV